MDCTERRRWSVSRWSSPTGLPATWNPSSFSFTDKSAATTQQPPAVRAGYLTDQGRFITVIQSDGVVADILAAEVGTVSPPTGTEQVGDAEWTVTSGRRDEVAWLRTVGDVTFLITGTAHRRISDRWRSPWPPAS